MNEEQRKAGTIDILNERNKKQKKTIVNISNMFINHLILKKQKACKQDVQYNRDFHIEDKYKGMGKDEHFN